MKERPRVLVVEDDTSTRQMLTQVLEGVGFNVLVAADGEQALRVATAEPPDAIVLDMGLPYLDGSGFAQQWRERDRADVPIVGISALPYGYAMACEVGVAAFFDKPFDFYDFCAKVGDLAERHWALKPRPGTTPSGSAEGSS